MIELLISLGILNVALLAIFAAFNSGALAVARASQTSTASVLADKQMEVYRAVTYSNVALDTSDLTGSCHVVTAWIDDLEAGSFGLVLRGSEAAKSNARSRTR